MKIFLLFAIFLSVNASYLANFQLCPNTTCTDNMIRGGTIRSYDCDPATFQAKCVEANPPRSTVCYNSTDDIPFSFVSVKFFPPSDSSCETSEKTHWIIRTNMCEYMWKVSVNSTHMIQSKYDNNDCIGEIVQKYENQLDTCLNSNENMYQKQTLIKYHPYP